MGTYTGRYTIRYTELNRNIPGMFGEEVWLSRRCEMDCPLEANSDEDALSLAKKHVKTVESIVSKWPIRKIAIDVDLKSLTSQRPIPLGA